MTAGAATFCAAACRIGFNNRRKTRGADLYDLFMAHRFDRPLARALGVLTGMNRLAAQWRQEDRRERGGRSSWASPELVFARMPWLRGRVLDRGRM